MEVEPPLHPQPPPEEAISPQLTASEAAASPSSGYLAEDPASPADEKPEALVLPPPPPAASDPVAAMFAALHAGRMGLSGLASPLHPPGLLPGPKMEVKPEPSLMPAESPVSSQTSEIKVEAGKDRSRRFFCQYCNKGFSLMNVLKVHERIHTGEKPYVCDICHKAFNQSGSLNRHKNTHLRRMEGNRTNKCRFCDKQFLYSSQLQDHEATSHRQELTAAKTPPTPSGLPAPTAAALSNNLVAQAIASSIMGSAGSSVNGNGLSGIPGLAPSPVTSSAGPETPLVNQIRVLAAAAAKQAEEQETTCKTCGKKFANKEQLLIHEQEHFMSLSEWTGGTPCHVRDGGLAGHLINAMSNHPGGQGLPGLPPLMPQAAAAAAALVSSPLSSLSRFGLNGAGPSGGGQLAPATLQQLLQLHFPSLGHHGLSGPPKTPLGGMATSAGVSNDENRAVEAKPRSLLTAVPPLPPTSMGLECGEGPLRLSPPSTGSGVGLPPLLGPLTLDVGGEQLRLGERPYTCRYCRKSFSQNGTLKRHYTTCKEARNVATRPASDLIRHRPHLKTRNDNVVSGSSLGAPSGDSSGESDVSGDGDVRKLMDIGPTPQPPKETVELVAHGFDMVDGPQDLSVVTNATGNSGNDSDRPLNGDCSPTPEEGEMLPRSRKRKLDEALPSSSRPASDLSPHVRDGLRDTESRPISQCSLHEIMRYLTMKNKLYRCEHCQIFFLDSALYYMHRSVHSQDAPLRCAICGYEATEKYNFHSHLMDHNKMSADRAGLGGGDEEAEDREADSVSSSNLQRASSQPTSD